MKQELDVIEAQGIISKVQQPTPWCIGHGGCEEERNLRRSEATQLMHT